jgi:hypothetical protein
MISANVTPTVPFPPISGPRTTEISLRDHFAGHVLNGIIAADADTMIRAHDPNLNGHANLAKTCISAGTVPRLTAKIVKVATPGKGWLSNRFSVSQRILARTPPGILFANPNNRQMSVMLQETNEPMGVRPQHLRG